MLILCLKWHLTHCNHILFLDISHWGMDLSLAPPHPLLFCWLYLTFVNSLFEMTLDWLQSYPVLRYQILGSRDEPPPHPFLPVCFPIMLFSDLSCLEQAIVNITLRTWWQGLWRGDCFEFSPRFSIKASSNVCVHNAKLWAWSFS